MQYFPTIRSLLDQTPWWDVDWVDVSEARGLNIYEEKNRVVVEAAVPGMEPDNIKVTYEDGVLSITAKKDEEEEKKKEGRKVHRWTKMARFSYTTYLPRPIDPKSLEATVKNGVVIIGANVAEEAKAKEVKVQVS